MQLFYVGESLFTTTGVQWLDVYVNLKSIWFKGLHEFPGRLSELNQGSIVLSLCSHSLSKILWFQFCHKHTLIFIVMHTHDYKSYPRDHVVSYEICNNYLCIGSLVQNKRIFRELLLCKLSVLPSILHIIHWCSQANNHISKKNM